MIFATSPGWLISVDKLSETDHTVTIQDRTDELHKLLMILRSTIGGAMWTLDDEEEELAVRTEKAIEALAVYHKGTKS